MGCSKKQKNSDVNNAFWNISIEQQYKLLNTSHQGLKYQDVEQHIKNYGFNRLNHKNEAGNIRLFFAQFKNSIILILLFATGLSFFLNDRLDAAIILTIVLISGCLGFWQEKGAASAIKELLAIVQITVCTLRDGVPTEIPSERLTLGDIIPGDCLLIDSDNLFIDEALLTGESYPVEKLPGILPGDTPLVERTNALWMGTHVQSGKATVLVIKTGQSTEFGKLAHRIQFKAPETEFEHGIRRFGYLLMEVTLILVILIFAVNVYLTKPVIDSFLFALALAVGLTPQLLPAIISVNLAHGARRMAEQKVIVKQLASIENFGSMNVLCSDKTGTLTEGTVHVHAILDLSSNVNDKLARYAYLNSFYETGFSNPIDDAIRQYQKFDLKKCEKLAEVPYDFYRKCLSLLLKDQGETILVTKGALTNILAICSQAEMSDGSLVAIEQESTFIMDRYEEFSRKGFRTLGLAYKLMPNQTELDKTDEFDLCFLGFLVFFDPPKTGCSQTIQQLNTLGVTLKIITGDNRLVAKTVSKQLGIAEHELLTGSEIREMSESALINQVAEVNLFAEIEPNQKERIILALKKAGFVVGYIGDGINDVSALHAADVGISVDSAADVAKETAQIVLLEKDLGVLVQGVREGRITFANTLKYVFMATSSNFGNMFSMAGASLFLPFLPLLPKQILLTNLLTDFPEMTIASDNVDTQMVAQPRRWDIKFIRKFMITFGFVSSLFDFMTFGLLIALDVSAEQFRTAWFLESVVSASLIVFIVRSSSSFFKTRPGDYLIATTLMVVAFTLSLPFTPIAPIVGFVALPLSLIGLLLMIVMFYLSIAEIAKHIFYRLVKM